MFERFTAEVRAVLVRARESATTRGDSYIGTEHLLIAMTAPESGLASDVLNAVGVTTDRVMQQLAQRSDRPALVTAEDLEVLESLGIDARAILDQARQSARSEPGPRTQAEVAELLAGAIDTEERPEVRSILAEAVARLRGGAGRVRESLSTIPFTPAAKKTLELSLREALTVGDNYIGTEHLLLGLVRQGGLGAELLVELGADLDDVRRRTLEARFPGRREPETPG